MRRRLHPLSIHLGMAAANIAEVNYFAQQCGTTISEADAVKMMRGIQMYQSSEFIAKRTDTKEVWTENSAKLVKLNNTNSESLTRPLVLIPSLINKSYIFNLSDECSILKWLNDNGINGYIFDWGSLQNHDAFQTIIEDRLNPALTFLENQSENKEIDVLGYCMGGTLLHAYYSSINVNIRNMIALAAPWNFNVENMNISKHIRIASPLVMPQIEKKETLPAEWIQALFASVDPNGTAQKFINFSQMDQTDAKARKFITVEDWLNDGVNLPSQIAHECMQSWFINNKLYKNKAMNIDANLMVVASPKDKLVPYESAAALTNNITAKTINLHEVNTGHIGLIAGGKAIPEVWQPIREWLISK